MYKNMAIVLLACCCIYLVVSQRMERNAWEERPLDAAAYGGLIALRDVLPAAEYQKEVAPLLERAAAEGHISYRQLRDLDEKLPDVGRQALDAARKARPGEELAKAWEDARQGAAHLGDEVSRNMRDMLEQLSRMVDKVDRSAPSSPSVPAPRPEGSDAPAQI